MMDKIQEAADRNIKKAQGKRADKYPPQLLILGTRCY